MQHDDSLLKQDEMYMRMALSEAEKALIKGEIPVGAIVVCQNRVIAKAHNLTEALNDVTAHAEMQAFTSATHFIGGKYLNQCTLYVTLEPCVMCAGAAFWTQLGRLVFGASDKKRGYKTVSHTIVHPKTKVKNGVLENECSDILIRFFQEKRKKRF